VVVLVRGVSATPTDRRRLPHGPSEVRSAASKLKLRLGGPDILVDLELRNSEFEFNIQAFDG
jgi:hypothetical protein